MRHRLRDKAFLNDPMSKPLKVLIVEDRLTDAELMIYELQRSGFQPEWQRVETEADYLAECKKTPDVILTDHNLPEFDAPRVLELLKKSGLDIPCIEFRQVVVRQNDV